MRIEKDSLGELPVPDHAYYGIQTVRCSANYDITQHTYNEYPPSFIVKSSNRLYSKSFLSFSL